jgi:Flp pilus assembly protein TadD
LSQPSNRPAWVSAVVIAAAILFAYAPGLHTPFEYDDLSNVVENTTIRDVSDVRLALSPPRDETSTAGRPLLNLSFAIDYAISKLDVAGYHATNIALHLICALLVFAIVRRTAAETSSAVQQHADVIAAAAAAIWAVHPLQTGVVTYISGRSESLVGVWYLLTLLAAIRAHAARHARGWTLLAVAACAVGMLCKESMVTAPVAVLLYDRAYRYDRWADAFAKRRALYAGLAATWVIAAVLAAQAPRSESAGFSAGVSTWTYLLNQAIVIPDYLKLAAWPSHLLFAYGEPRQLTLSDVGATGLIVPALLVSALWLWHRHRALGFPALWVFLTLAPTSSIVPIATEAGAARRMYLPLAGIVVLFAIGVVVAAKGRRLVTPAIVAVIVEVLTATTMGQMREFSSPELLWRGSAERWPSALAHRNLAATLLQQGRRAEGIDELRAASELKPLARYSLGIQLFEQGRVSEAIVELQRALHDVPDDRESVLSGRRVLGRALRAQGRHREAADVFAQIVAMMPDDLEARLSQADELLAAGDLSSAHREYQQILAQRPDHLGALTNDGLLLLRLGRLSDALPMLRTVAERRPADVAANMNLASASAAAGLVGEAAGAACRAIAADPRSPSPRQLLADVRAAAAAAHVSVRECGER